MHQHLHEELQHNTIAALPDPIASAHQGPGNRSNGQAPPTARPLKPSSCSVVVAIPARLESSRLPGKLIADIHGKPMVRHVLERCAQARSATAIRLCTDSPDLAQQATLWGFTAVMTSAHCSSGSDRLASVVRELIAAGGRPAAHTLILNVQGDQPCLDPQLVDAIAAAFTAREPTPDVLTPIYRLPADKLHNPNVVKVLLAADGRALYFSRSALPHVRDADPAVWSDHTSFWGHVGIYAYRADVLMQWLQLPESPLEQLEKLEQLRLIEAGIRIDTLEVSGDILSVDTAEQLEQARALMGHHDPHQQQA
jgi:3-deoxy-manno-octulosonate cytidylyltransferase (CMP-KDO synthetase)